MGKGMGSELNRLDQLIITGNPYANRAPLFWVGVFNVAKQPFRIHRPWVIGGVVKIEAREEGELYSKPFIIPDIVGIAKPPVGNDEIIIVPQKGEFLAQDICNMNDPFGSWKTYRPLSEATRWNDGNNYYERGLFWVKLETPDSPPDLEAVQTAIERLEKYYSFLINEANKFYTSGPKGQEMICGPHHEAAEYFLSAGNDLNLPWHAVMKGGLHGLLGKAREAKS
jgi:hypothetical protein